jgi:acyl-CoA synthetase (AMP-forming)/AMP-acid ligase II
MTPVPRLLDSPLAAAERFLDEAAVVSRASTWTWRQIHEASIDLSIRLGKASALCNLCDSRTGFLVTWLAALRNRCRLILPPSGGQADLDAILKLNAGPAVVVDSTQVLLSRHSPGMALLSAQPEWQPARATAAELAWQPAWDDADVLLYTSGSTGTPAPHAKTLRQLAAGALALGARLSQDIDGGLDSIQRLVCSVPPQHMFGLECSVMLPLMHAMAVLEGRPLLPADVRAAFIESPAAAWIATPLHMRFLAQSGVTLPNCRVVVASTMALSPALACKTEALAGAPVLEIYGSTETGVLAMRRTAQDSAWRTIEGVRIESMADATLADGEHFPSPATLPDRVEVDADGSFALRGRQDDVIKIAGRRASLAGLNLLLQELPGLEDGVFYMPAAGNATERLCLIHSGPALPRAETDAWLRARVDPVFLPRTLIRVDRLPRSASGKLPRPALEQIVERWQAGRHPPSSIAMRLAVPIDHPALPGHFPGHAIVPGVLLLDQVIERLRAKLHRAAIRLQRVKFASALLPGEIAQVDCDVDGLVVSFRASAWRDGAAVLLANGQLLFGDQVAAP